MEIGAPSVQQVHPLRPFHTPGDPGTSTTASLRACTQDDDHEVTKKPDDDRPIQDFDIFGRDDSFD